MKLRLAISQLQELTLSQQDKLRAWWDEHRQQGDVFMCLGNDFLGGKVFSWDGHNKSFNMSIPLISIGQCIEILREYDVDRLSCEFWQLAHGIEGGYYGIVDECIDILW